jgi:hypothetical protein
MLAIAAFVAFVIAAFKAATGHASPLIWFVIIGGLLVSAEVAWGWNRTGRYRRGA